MLGKTHFTNRILWIILAFFGWFMILGSFAELAFQALLQRLFPDVPDEVSFILEFYTPVLGSCLVFLLMCVIVKKDRPLLEVIKPTRAKRSMSWLGIGLLLGFLSNFFCIICALLHGDIKLSPSFSASQIPFYLFALLSVFIQSTGEELWCRCMLYERINVHYPLWVAIAVNSTLFGLLHSFNDGITALAMADLIICGLAYSLLRWYTGSIWCCFGIHTMWNFTQNLIFGLPNSGLVSRASMFTLDAANGTSNLIYDYTFGVEGALPAVLSELLIAAVIIWAAAGSGRLGELMLSKEMTGEAPRMEAGSPRAGTYDGNSVQEDDDIQTVRFVK